MAELYLAYSRITGTDYEAEEEYGVGGGGIFLNDPSTATVLSSPFSNCDSALSGGGIYLVSRISDEQIRCLLLHPRLCV